MSAESTSFSLRRVLKGATIYSLGDVLVKASGFFLIPVYTRVLTPADYGVIGYLQVFLSVATVILMFGFNGAQTRYYHEHGADMVMQCRFAFTINLVPVVVGLVLIVPLAIAGRLLDWTVGAANIPFWPFMVLTMGTVVLQVMANNAVAWFRTRQQYVAASVLQVTRFFAVTGFSLVLILGFGYGALGRVAGLFAGMLVFTVLSFAGYARYFVFRPSKAALAYAVGFGAPLVMHHLAGQVHNMIDRVILERYVGLDDLGIYTLAVTVGMTLNTFVGAFNQAYKPGYYALMSSEAADREAQIVRTFKAWLIMITGLATGGILLGGPFLRVFAGPRFVATIDVFPWIILSVFTGGFYLFFSKPLFYFKKTTYLPPLTIAGAAANVGLNLVLIPRMGMIGAAIATVISHGIHSGITLLVGNRVFPVRWPWGWVVASLSVVGGSVAATTIW